MIMNNRIRSLLVLILGLILFFLFWGFKPSCLFKELFSFQCPACGMTRAFECIFSFDILTSFTYNILAFPLFIFIIVCIVLVIFDLVTDDSLFFKKLNSFFSKYYLIIIVLLVISMGVNIYRGI